MCTIQGLDNSLKTLEKKLKVNNNLTKVTEKTIRSFIDEIYSKPPKKNYITNKTEIYFIDNVWISGILDLRDYGSENNRGHRYVSVVIDNFSKFEWTVPLKNKNAQTVNFF